MMQKINRLKYSTGYNVSISVVLSILCQDILSRRPFTLQHDLFIFQVKKNLNYGSDLKIKIVVDRKNEVCSCMCNNARDVIW